MRKASCILGMLAALAGTVLLAGSASAQPGRGGPHQPYHQHRDYHGGYPRGYGYGRPVYVAPPPPCYRPVRRFPAPCPVPVLAPVPVAPVIQPGFSFSLFFGG